MSNHSIKNVSVVLVVAGFLGLAAFLVVPATAQQPNVTRTVLQHNDSAIPGYDVNLVSVEIPVGAMSRPLPSRGK